MIYYVCFCGLPYVTKVWHALQLKATQILVYFNLLRSSVTWPTQILEVGATVVPFIPRF